MRRLLTFADDVTPLHKAMFFTCILSWIAMAVLLFSCTAPPVEHAPDIATETR